MIYSSEAIVLENKPYGEADLIVTYFTKEFGILTLFAKSPRKIKSKFGSSLEPLTYSKISFIGKEEKLQKIIQSDILYPFQKIREDYKLFIKLVKVLREILPLLPGREKNTDFFQLLLNVLKYIERGDKVENFLIFFRTKALYLLGYIPDLMHCGQCSETLKKEWYYHNGFILCKNCVLDIDNKEDIHQISRGTVFTLRSLLKWKIPLLSRVNINEILLKEMETFITRHIRTVIKN